jgi:chorismate mutase
MGNTTEMKLQTNPLEKLVKKHTTIAGPCSVENEEQIHEIAKQLAAGNNIDILRGGIWKPRTRPNSFEGIGVPALSWLKDAGNAFNLPVATEVANALHVEAALKEDIDILWLGARTTVNPFAVQEIADALKGVDIPVMVKNPINPDLELWMGAIERLNAVGIDKIMAIHRGFSASGNSQYRNIPKWDIPIELKRRIPGIQIIVDPSHIGGTRELIPTLSQKALDLDFDGLMVETHHNPDKALSDAKQQVTPDSFKAMMESLTFRERKSEDLNLDDLRESIDDLDKDILDLVIKRMDIVDAIAKFKKNHNVTILQAGRWEKMLEDRIGYGAKNELTEKFIYDFFKAIHAESINKQSKIMNK